MTALLVHVGIGLLICSCILQAPHVSKGTGIAGSIAFSVMSGISIGAFVVFTLLQADRATEQSQPAGMPTITHKESRA